jgi:ATP:ADP antiporter, AAA family
MLLAHPMFTAIVARLPRHRFVPLVYRFFILNLIAFFVVFRAVDPAQAVWVGRVFFVRTNVFNLSVVSVFWSLMADLYRPSRGRRLFGLIAVGGTLGSILGASITSGLSHVLSATSLLLPSAVLLELAAQSARALDRQQEAVLAASDECAPRARRRRVRRHP